jgi:5'-nucleotidase
MRRRFVASALATGLVLGTVALPAAGQETGFTLTVLHANDGESELLPSAFQFGDDDDLVALACPDGAAEPGFDDVSATNVHRDALACGVERDVINGLDDTTYAPLAPVQRGQAASLVERVLVEAGIALPPFQDGATFPDLDATHGDAVRRLEAAGIVDGLDDGRFGTYDAVTRAQLASLLVRALGHVRGEPVEPSGEGPFTDVPEGVAHSDNIAAAAELGLLQGRSDGTFGPYADTARDQAATVAVRLLGRTIGETVPAGGAARFVAQVKSLQADATAGDDDGVVTVSSGDNFLAGPQYTASTESYADGGPFYDALVYQQAGFDAITIGNHEFDFGPQGLVDFVEATTGIPFLSANLDFSGEPALQQLVEDGRIADSTVVDADGRDVGIIGATTEDLDSVTSPGAVTAGDVEAAVEAEVDALTADGIEIIVLSSHLQNLDNERALVGNLTGVDAVVGGGGAEALETYPIIEQDADGENVPIVTTPGSYRDIGKLVLEFDAAGELTAVGDDSELQPIAPYGPKDEATRTDVEEPVAAAVAELAETVVADSEVDLDGRTASVRTRETNLGDLLSDGMLDAAQERAEEFGVLEADVALQNGGGIRGNAILEAGDITALDTFNIAPFGNRLAVDTVSAEELVALIEHGISDLPAVEGKFGQWAGVEFTYEVDQDAGSRIDDAVVTRADGTEVNLVVAGVTNTVAGDFTVAGLNFTLAGGDDYPFDGDFDELGITDQQVFRGYLETLGTVTAGQYPNLTIDEDRYLRFGPVGGDFIDGEPQPVAP